MGLEPAAFGITGWEYGEAHGCSGFGSVNSVRTVNQSGSKFYGRRTRRRCVRSRRRSSCTGACRRRSGRPSRSRRRSQRCPRRAALHRCFVQAGRSSGLPARNGVIATHVMLCQRKIASHGSMTCILAQPVWAQDCFLILMVDGSRAYCSEIALTLPVILGEAGVSKALQKL